MLLRFELLPESNGRMGQIEVVLIFERCYAGLHKRDKDAFHRVLTIYFWGDMLHNVVSF